ncbi:MAG: lipoprotein-releasing system ATP-binding protein [Candidatus Cloacimonadota bacterium]|nr:lipoprotein-releasing system ATP-binding protein [Candidatus Cloacimonadota bacterium]
MDSNKEINQFTDNYSDKIGVRMSILRAENLRKTYPETEGRLEVFRNLDFSVEKGQIAVITGQSGSGKSTLLHLLGLLDSADEGRIFYNEQEVNLKQKNIHEFRNRTIGFVFQFHYLLEDFTAEENIAMPMFLQNKDLGKSLQQARELLKKLDIYNRRQHYPNQLSGGEQQRVAVARALINSPQIIFADEPTGNLDEEHSKEIIELISSLNKIKHQTFVIVTHNQEIAQKMHVHYNLKNGNLTKIK